MSRYGLEAQAGDVLDGGSLARVFLGADAVIHLVGIISELSECTFENVHAGGTTNAVAAARQAGVARFVHMSALGTRPQARSRYHQSKWAAEEVVRRCGMDFTIFRPSLIFGPEDQFVNRFAGLIRFSPVVPVLGSRTARFQPVAVESVARAFVASLAEPRAFGQTYDLCGPQSFTLARLLDEILEVMGRRRLKLRVPCVVARGQAAFLEFVFPRLLGRPAPLNREQLIMLQEDNVGNSEPANQLFGLEPLQFKEGIGYVKR